MSKQENKSKKGKRRVILLAVFGFLLAIVIAVAVFFALNPTWVSHIKAAVLFLTNSKENLESNIQQIEKQRIEAVQNSGFSISKEVEIALAGGQITEGQFQNILLGYMSLEDAISENNKSNEPNNSTFDDENVKNDNGGQGNQTEKDEPQEPSENISDEKTEATENKPDKKDDKPVETKPSVKPESKPQNNDSANKNEAKSKVDEQIASLVTKMYVLKANYVGQIEGIVDSMKNEFYLLPAEQQTKSSKQSIATKYLSKINEMEAQCDAQVNAVVTELKQILTKDGRDHSLANAIISTYNAEKDNTKAYYISTYGD